VNDALAIAFDLASGREPASSAPFPPALLAFARRVVAAGRRALASPPVPALVLRRAVALADGPVVGRGSRGASAVSTAATSTWRMLFDSWAGRVPAMRGGGRSRFLRYARASSTLDVELVVGDGGALGVRGTADGVPPKASLRLVPARGRAIVVAVRAGGAFAASVPARAGAFTIEVRAGRRSLGTTPRIPPPAA